MPTVGVSIVVSGETRGNARSRLPCGVEARSGLRPCPSCPSCHCPRSSRLCHCPCPRPSCISEQRVKNRRRENPSARNDCVTLSRVLSLREGSSTLGSTLYHLALASALTRPWPRVEASAGRASRLRQASVRCQSFIFIIARPPKSRSVVVSAFRTRRNARLQRAWIRAPHCLPSPFWPFWPFMPFMPLPVSTPSLPFSPSPLSTRTIVLATPSEISSPRSVWNSALAN